MSGAVNPIRSGGNQIIFNTGVINNIGGNTAGVTANISTGTFLLAGGDNVTLSQNGNSVTISAGGGLTSQSGQALSGSNGSFAFQTASFGNLNGVSFYTSNGSLVASHNGLTAQSVQTQNLHNVTLGGNTAGVMAEVSSGTMTLVGGNNITLSQNGNAITISAGAGGAGSISGGTTRGTLGEVVFSNSNGVSFGMNGQTMTGSHDGLTTQLNQALSGSNGSLAFETASFGNLNGMSFYTSNGSMVGSYTVPTQSNQTLGAYAASNTTQASSGTIDARSLSFQGAGVASVGISNGSVVISVPSGGGGGLGAGISTQGNTSGTTGLVSANLLFVGSGNIGLSQSLDGGSATLTIKDLATLNAFVYPMGVATTGNAAANFLSQSFCMMPLQCNLTATRVDLLYSVSISSSTNNTMRGTYTMAFGMYSLNGATLTQASSGSQTYSWSATSNGSTSRYNGLKNFSIPIDINATPGNWWYGIWASSGNGGTSEGGGARFPVVGAATALTHSGFFGSAVNASYQILPGNGVYSSSSATLQVSANLNSIRGNSSLGGQMVVFKNIGVN
jgi:hypothetical protein